MYAQSCLFVLTVVTGLVACGGCREQRSVQPVDSQPSQANSDMPSWEAQQTVATATDSRTTMHAGENHHLVTLDDIKSAWMERQKRVRSARFAWKGPSSTNLQKYDVSRVEYAKSSSNAWKADTHELDWTLMFDGKLVRHSSYGKKLIGQDGKTVYMDHSYTCVFGSERNWSDYGTSEQSSGKMVPTGFVGSNEGGYPERWNFYVTPVVLHYRPFERTISPILGTLTLLDATGVVMGKKCLIVKDAGDAKVRLGDSVYGPLGTTEYWVDPDRDFVIVRVRQFSPQRDDVPSVQFDITYSRDAQHGWVPSEWNGTKTLGDDQLSESWSNRVTSYELNCRVDPADFDYIFSPGTWVTDRRNRSHYIVRADGSKRIIKQDETLSGRTQLETYRKLLQSSSGEAVPTEFRNLRNLVYALPRRDEKQQRQFAERLMRYLLTSPPEERFPGDYILVVSFARSLVDGGQAKMAMNLFRDVASLFPESDQQKLSRWADSNDGRARRINLPGNQMRLVGTTADGHQFDWSSYRGKVVLVDFWFTGCPPCLEEMPHIQEVYESYHERGFDVVGVSVDENAEALAAYLATAGIPWTTIHEPEAKKGSNTQHYDVTSFPTSILTDRDGKVVSLEARGNELDRLLGELIGPPAAQP